MAIAPGSQRSPAVHGNTVVWADNRNSPMAGAGTEEHTKLAVAIAPITGSTYMP